MADPNQNRLVLVTGATGKQGGAALHAIRERGFRVRAMTRDPERPAARALAGQGVEVVAGDFTNADSLRAAMDGIYGVFAMSAFAEGGIQGEIEQGKQLADAARRSGVTHYVYSSVGGADRKTGIPHFDSKFQVEEHVRGLGFPYVTSLRPVFFMENWLWSKDAVASGNLPAPLKPGTSLQQIAVSDIGTFAALAFEHPDHWNGKAVELAGDELSGTQQAEAFSAKTGKPVQYQQMPEDQVEKNMGPEMATMYRWFEEHGYKADIPALRREHPGLKTFASWLNQNWK